MPRKVPHCVSCLTLFLDKRPPSRPHCHKRLRKGVSWPSRLAGSRAARSAYLAIEQSRSRSEGGHATGRCYSFLKPSPTARRAWPRPTLGPAVDYEISWEPGPDGRPLPHVSISVDASHPTGRRKVPFTRRTELVGVVSKVVCPGALCRHAPVECLPSNVT
jgi:hypothetical protein